MKKQTELEKHCIRFYNAFDKISGTLSDEEIEKAYVEYESSSNFRKLSGADISAICRLTINCWRDEVDFEIAINKLLTKRKLI